MQLCGCKISISIYYSLHSSLQNMPLLSISPSQISDTFSWPPAQSRNFITLSQYHNEMSTNSAKSCAVILQNTQTIPLNSRFIYSKCHHPPQTHAAVSIQLNWLTFTDVFFVPLKADTRKTPYISNRILVYDSIFTHVNCCVFPCKKVMYVPLGILIMKNQFEND